MFKRVSLFAASVGLWALPPLAFAQRTLAVYTGIRASFADIFTGIINFLAGAAAPVALSVFLIGAFIMTLSRGDESQIKKGKDIMIGSLIGLFVILGSYGILRTVLFFIS